MKEIKAYLSNQKDIFTTMWLTELQKEEPNLAMVKHYLEMANCISLLQQGLNKTIKN